IQNDYALLSYFNTNKKYFKIKISDEARAKI
ncbi:hypothetical protein CCACVL1_03721, partial [Corchorus capsularis]